jgi:ornithine cyclodeaminase/alanine dehydrogenase-like protein (mu-crystallin family)
MALETGTVASKFLRQFYTTTTRSFSTATMTPLNMIKPKNTIAFIGLGVMGYPMAVNLRKKIGQDQKLVVCDVSKEAVERFKAQTQELGPVEIVSNGFEAAKAAVGSIAAI